MKERTYCTGKWQGGCHRTYECGVRALCEKYIALQKYLEKILMNLHYIGFGMILTATFITVKELFQIELKKQLEIHSHG